MPRGTPSKHAAAVNAAYNDGYKAARDLYEVKFADKMRADKEAETRVRREAVSALTEVAKALANIGESMARALMSERNQL